MTQLITPLTLYTCIYEIEEYASWFTPDGENDPWIGRAYQWKIKFICQPQNTGNFDNNFAYTAENVVEGDWIAMSSGAIALSVKIVEIIDIIGGAVTAIVEDIDRYNIHLTNDNGINAPSSYESYDSIIFRLGEDGMPIFASLTSLDIKPVLYQEIISRFEFRNYLQNNYRLQQVGNTFEIGDEISLTSDGTYILASAIGTAAYKAIGRVKDINIPSNGWFTFEPKGKLSRYLTPDLPGDPGDIVYLDPTNPGKLTATRPTNGIAVPIFIKIDNSTGVKLDEVLPGGLDNFSATSAPTVNDDSGDGYSYGSLWVDTLHKKSYINVDPTVGSSIWQEIGSGNSNGNGYTGSVGYTGSAGLDGAYAGKGYTGSMGPQGPAGGYTGSRGSVGYTGSAPIANATTQAFTGNGTATVFTLNAGMVNQNNAIVTINGLVQQPILHYTVVGTALTFTFAPYSNASIEVRNMEQGAGYWGSVASKQHIGFVQIGENIDVTEEGVISVTKGAGINKLVDIPDVDSTYLSEGSYLSYRKNLERWEADTIGAVFLDGGNY